MEMTVGLMKCRTTRARSTRMAVITAWRMPTVMAWRPMCRSCSKRNSLPMVKAMKPRATWEIMFRDSTSAAELKPRLNSCSAPMQ